MRRSYPRDPLRIAAPSEKNEAIKYWVAKYDEERRMRVANQSTLKARATEAREAKQEAKSAKGQLVTLTKAQKAKEEASKAGYWSGGAAIAVALFYELCKASDAWISGAQYREFWTHEAMISTLTFMMTTLFGWAYKCAHPDSK